MPQSSLSAAARIASPRPLVIAHRGASWQFPENTLPSFAAAVAVGADAVEFDFQAAADGTLVVIHDDTLERTTNAAALWGHELAVRHHPWAELSQLDAGSWFGPQFRGTALPTLEQALAAIVPQAIAVAERKSGPAGELVSQLRSLGCLDRVVVQAFDWAFLADCRRLAPELTLAVLGEKTLRAEHLDEAVRLGARAVGWDDAASDAGTIAAIHARGMRAWVWTVDDPARQQQLLAWNVDGLITNDPAALVAHLS